MKKYLGNRISSLKENRFSKIQLVVFVLVFAGVGSYILISSHAAPAPKSNPHASQNALGALVFEKQELHLASGDVVHNSGRRPILLPKLKTIATQRKTALLKLFQTDPHTARGVALAGSDAAALKGLGVDVEQPVTLSGQLGVFQLDDQTGDHFYYQLITPDKKTYFLDTEQAVPQVKPGSTIQVSGLALDNQLLINLSSTANPNYSPTSTEGDPLVAFANDGTAPVNTTSTPDATGDGSTFTTTGNITDAIIMGNFAGSSNAVTSAQTQKIYSNNPGSDVASFLHENSGGKATLAPAYLGPYSIPSVSCGNTSGEESALEAAATNAGANLNNYEVHTYVTNCNEGEFASAGGTADIRYNYISYYGLSDIHGPAHELSHTLDAVWIMLGHGGYLDCAPQTFSPPVESYFDTGACQVAEYEDPYDVLGGGESNTTGQFGAPHKIDAGWLDSTQMAVDTTPGTTSYTLAPTENNNGLVALKIPRGNSGTYFTAEFRQPIGFDSFITGSNCPFCNANQGALVRLGGISYNATGGGADSNILDMTPGSHADIGSYWPALDGDDGTLLPGQSFTDPEYNITIKTVSASSSALTVQVTVGSTSCNYAAPTVSPLNPSSLTVSPGQTGTYSFTVTNNDSSGCQPQPFKYSYNSSGGIDTTATPDYFTLAPGASTTVTAHVSVSTSATDNYYYVGGSVISKPYGVSPVSLNLSQFIITSAADTTPPTAPTNPQISVLGSAAVKLSWSPSTDNVGVAGYRISVSNNSQQNTTATSYTVLGLLPSTSYSFTVQAYDNHNNLSSPVTISATTPAKSFAPPTTPGVPTFSISDHSFTLNWSRAYSPSGIACYVLYNGGAGLVCNNSGTSLTSSSIPSQTAFNKVGVLAYDGDGNITYSDQRNFTTNVEGDSSGPSTPQQVYISSRTAAGDKITWQPSTDVRTITGYYIYSGCCKIAFTTNANNYFDGSGHYADYRVQAVDSDGNISPTSNDTLVSYNGNPTSDVTPPTASVSAPANNSTVSGNVTLQSSASDNVAVAGVTYWLDGQHNLGSGSASAPYSLNIDTTKYADGPHWIIAEASDSSTNVGTSVPINVTFNNYGNTQPPDTTPPAVSITSPASGSTVSGTTAVSANASDNVAVARVDFLVDGTLQTSDTASPYGFSLDTTKLTNGSHVITANAYDTSNNESSSQITVNVSNGDTVPPTTPTNLSANAPAYNQVSLSWTASSDNVGVTGYYIVRNGTTIAQTTGTGTSYTDSSVSASTNYSYQVMARDAAGNTSTLSNTATVTTPSAPDTTPPSTPTNLIATAVSSSQINLAWTASTDNIGVASYDIYRNSAKLTSVSASSVCNGASCSFGNTGLSASTTYTYYVIARDAAGNSSSPSTTVSATTQPVPPPPTTASLSGLVTSSSTGNGISGALVSLSAGGKHGTTMNTSTTSTGSYSFATLNPATYNASYSASGYTSQKLSSTVTSGVTTTQNVSLNACTARHCK